MSVVYFNAAPPHLFFFIDEIRVQSGKDFHGIPRRFVPLLEFQVATSGHTDCFEDLTPSHDFELCHGDYGTTMLYAKGAILVSVYKH